MGLGSKVNHKRENLVAATLAPHQQTVGTAPPFIHQAIDSTASLVKAFAETLNLSRLPAPEPSVFNGDLLNYTDWKASFIALIDSRCSSPSEKMHYLRRYVGGDVRKVLENCLLQNNAAAYDEAWDVLNQSYGDLFSVGQAFWERLFSWPKISSNDSKGIQDLAGFLRSCRATMHHVPSLQSLNNSHESQRIITRLPDWMISRWNRIIFAAIKN